MSPAAGPLVAGHQPNFLPWFGYFEKMLKCDIFVFSDDVQFPKRCFANRVEIPIAGAPAHLTLPVQKGQDQRIADKRYQKDEAVLDRLLKTVRLNLGGLPFSRDLEPVLEHFSAAYRRHDTLADLNISTNLFIAASLGIDTPVRRGTDLGLESVRRNERLIRRCELLGSQAYLCGQGADSYQDEAMLNAAGIGLTRIEYDIGARVLGEDLRYSILVGLARRGTAALSAAVAEWRARRMAA